MAKDTNRFTEGYDDMVAGMTEQLAENTRRRVEIANAYLTRKIDARVDTAEGNLLDNPAKVEKARDNLAKAEFTKKMLDGVEVLSGTPAKNAETKFEETDKLSKAPGKFMVQEVERRISNPAIGRE